jgi:hypothetical protein
MSTPVADAPSKHPDSGSKTMSKLSAKFDRLSSNVSRLGTAVKTTLNPNHRHDEEWEQEVDAKIEKIRDGHRFRSFAGERDGEYLAWVLLSNHKSLNPLFIYLGPNQVRTHHPSFFYRPINRTRISPLLNLAQITGCAEMNEN